MPEMLRRDNQYYPFLMRGQRGSNSRPPVWQTGALTKLSYDPFFLFIFSGPREARTPDLLNAIQALSQLSYGPEYFHINTY